jgi:hypothetical protein
MLLVHIYALTSQQGVSTGVAGGSGSSSSSGIAAADSGSSGSRDTSCGSSRWGGIGGSGDSQKDAAGSLEQVCSRQQEAQMQQLLSITRQLWQQLGLPPGALPAFAAGLDDCRDRSISQNTMGVSLCCIRLSMQDVLCLDGPSTAHSTFHKAQIVAYDQLSRQMQQLLQRVVWLLPQLLLLLLASVWDRHAEDGGVLLVEVMVCQAMLLTRAWSMPGLMPAAAIRAAAAPSSAAAAAAAGTKAHARPGPIRMAAAAAAQASCQPGEPTPCSPSGQVSAVLDALLGLFHSLLLQPHHGLLHVAAAARPQLLQQYPFACSQNLQPESSPWIAFAATCGAASGSPVAGSTSWPSC